MKRSPSAFRISISVQILVFTLLVVFMPVASMLLLNTYEKQQLQSLESSLVQQARLLGASLTGDFTADAAEKILLAMNRNFDARLRVLDASGTLLSDSSTVGTVEDSADASAIQPEPESPAAGAAVQAPEEKEAQETLVYRAVSFPVRQYRKWFRPPASERYASADFYSGKKVYDGPEIQAALAGRYGAFTRVSSGEQVSVTLYSAIPVTVDGQVIGVVLASKSTYRILQNLYEIRRDIARIFLWSLLAVAAVTVFFYFRISRPLKKLSREAQNCTDTRGHLLQEKLTGSRRIDEIGDLSRSFTVLLKKLADRIRYTEQFSADVSHEFKNPLAGIRSSVEMLSDGECTGAERSQYAAAITDEVARLEQLLSKVRRLSLIDAGGDTETESIPFDTFLQNMASAVTLHHPEVQLRCALNATGAALQADPELLFSMVSNLLENAASFGTEVLVESRLQNRNLVLQVHDNGPGIPSGSEETVFNRFYTTRRNHDGHSGLGLALVKSVAGQYGGDVTAGHSQQLGGACFTVTFPIL